MPNKQSAPRPISRIGGSLLPSSEPRILQPMPGQHGVLHVKPRADLDTYELLLDGSMVASHPNGYSCHTLAERILAAWDGTGTAERALDQFDYILRCGGRGLPLDEVASIVSRSGVTHGQG